MSNFRLRQLSLILLAPFMVGVMGALNPAARAAPIPLAAYHERVTRALAACDELVVEQEDVSIASPARDGALRTMREALPATPLEVEFNGSVTPADNSWLAAALDEYERAAGGRTDAENRLALRQIGGRLQALDARLAELEGEIAATRSSKEEDRAKLEAILRRFNNRREDEEGKTALARLREWVRDLILRFFDWLRGLLPSPPRMQPARGGAGNLSFIIQIVVYALALGLVVLLVWRLGPRLLAHWRARRGRSRSARREARVVLGEKVGAHESAADLLAEAEKLARAGELRAAIRKAYVAFLCELADRRQIHLEDHLTNRDYLQAVRQKPTLYTEMQPLTASFEKHWYGAAAPTEDDWAHFRTRYRAALGGN